MPVAFIQVNPLTVLQRYSSPPASLSVPGLGQVHGAGVGWTSPDGAYMLADLIPFVPPAGQMISGNPTYVLNGHTLTETYATVPLPSAAQAQSNYDNAIATGIVLTWTTSTTLNGTYAIDQRTMYNLTSIWTSVLANNAFPNNKTRQSWPQKNGTTVTFTPAQFNLFGTALTNYTVALEEARVAQAGGGSPTWPSSTVTITG